MAAEAEEEYIQVSTPDLDGPSQSPSLSSPRSYSSQGVASSRGMDRSFLIDAENTQQQHAKEEVDVEGLEETMRACLALANICQAKQAFADALFEKGLMRIMLKIVRSTFVEINRQVI